MAPAKVRALFISGSWGAHLSEDSLATYIHTHMHTHACTYTHAPTRTWAHTRARMHTDRQTGRCSVDSRQTYVLKPFSLKLETDAF